MASSSMSQLKRAVVFTRALDLSREAAADLAAQSGMTVKTGVTRLTYYLVVGAQDLTVPGSP